MAAPINIQSYPIFTAALSVADAGDFAGTGSLVTIVAGVAAGPRDVLYVIISPTATTTAGNVIRFFVDDGTNKVPVGDFIVPQVTSSANNTWRQPWIFTLPMGVLRLNGTSQILKCSEEKADAFKLMAQCADYQ